MKYILKKKLKFYTKEFLKIFNILIIAFGFIIAIILIKYKPMYKVSISGKQIGYIEKNQKLEEILKKKIIEDTGKTIEFVSINKQPEYELKLINRVEKTHDEEIIQQLRDDITITYKYYEIAMQEKVIGKVNTSEEAEQLIKEIKEENSNNSNVEINLNVVEKYTQNEEEIGIYDIETAKINIKKIAQSTINEEKKIKDIPSINNIKLAVIPVNGNITSRYGSKSRIRKSTHTGLDISAIKGTDIKVVADGVVVAANYDGAYGNLVKVNHGNNIETWYAHTSKMYVKKGDSVKAGDVIATVGSTGNSTGPHLHFELRVNGQHINPQNYIYR